MNTPRPDLQSLNTEQVNMLAEKTEKVCEMAAVMKEALKMDEENCNSQQELMARLVTENKVEQIINYSYLDLKARIAFFGFNSKSRLK